MHDAVTFTNKGRGAHHTPAGESLALLKLRHHALLSTRIEDE